MITFSSVWAFLKSKAGKGIIIVALCFIVFSAFMIMFAVKENAVRRNEEKIERQKEEIIRLELNNETLKKEIDFIKENEKFQNSFSNSSIMIDNLFKTKIRPADDKSSAPYREDLSIITKEENETFNNISNNFYKYFYYNKRFKNSQELHTVPAETVCAHFFRFNINFMQYKNKICKNAFIKTAGNIYNQVRNKSAGFNEKIPRKYYKNRRMAIMV